MYVKAENSCQTGRLRFKILAPSRREVPNTLTQDVLSSEDHSELLCEVQRLRGRVYGEVPAIAATLLPDGRNWQKYDAANWHILLEDSELGVVGCARYHSVSHFDDLICNKAAIVSSPETGPVFRSAFESQLAEKRRSGLHFGEAGGWALSDTARCSTAAVNIALMGFAVAEWLGAGMCITTATTRHNSSLILKRLGGTHFGGLEPYYEPAFDCMIELLQFDANSLHARFRAKLDNIRAELRQAPVYCPIESEDCLDLPIPSLPAPMYMPVSSSQHSAILQ